MNTEMTDIQRAFQCSRDAFTEWHCTNGVTDIAFICKDADTVENFIATHNRHATPLNAVAVLVSWYGTVNIESAARDAGIRDPQAFADAMAFIKNEWDRRDG